VPELPREYLRRSFVVVRDGRRECAFLAGRAPSGKSRAIAQPPQHDGPAALKPAHDLPAWDGSVLGGIVALPAVNSISTYRGKRVTNEPRSYRDSRRKAEEITVLILIAAGETGRMPAPKEQPPRKLSGKRTAQSHKTLERDADSGKRRDASADGITFSGKKTEGAPDDQHALMRCPNAAVWFRPFATYRR
jgi:hypothetical protein